MPTVKYLRDQRQAATVVEVIKLKFPFPNEQFPDLETIANLPKPRMSVSDDEKKPLYPHIVVVRRPGAWLQMLAEIETADTVTDESAKERWLPYSQCGDLYLYVPYGFAGEAKKVAKRNGVRLAGVRVWRFRPVWGLEVAEA